MFQLGLRTGHQEIWIEVPEPPIDGTVPEFGLESVIMIAILAPLMLLLVRRAKTQS